MGYTAATFSGLLANQVSFTFEDPMINVITPRNHCLIARSTSDAEPSLIAGIWTSGPEVGSLEPFSGVPGTYPSGYGHKGGNGNSGSEPGGNQ